MRCPNCGASILEGSSFCERCGLQVGTPQFRSSQLRSQPTNDNKVLWIVVIVVILLVVVPIILSAVLYIMVLGFGGTSTQTPEAMYQKSAIANGQEITIVAITKTDVPWDDVKIQVSDGTNIAEWSPMKVLQSTVTGHNYSTSTSLTGLTVCLWVYDVSGNGYVSGTDYFTIFTYGGATGFSATTQYAAVLLYEPSGERCGQSIAFTGTSTQTPTASYARNTITNGQKITIVSITKTDVPWDDVKIQVSDGTNIAQWSPTKAFQSSTVGHNYSTQTALSGLTVCLWVTDVSGNGFVSGTDYFTIFTYGGATGFSSTVQYSAVLLYEPSGERMGQPIAFTG